MSVSQTLLDYNNTLFVQQLEHEIKNRTTEFKEMMERLDLFRKECLERASDISRKNNNIQEMYGISITNVAHPLHHVESFWFVDMTDSQDWFLNSDEIDKLLIYGFIVKWEDCGTSRA